MIFFSTPPATQFVLCWAHLLQTASGKQNHHLKKLEERVNSKEHYAPTGNINVNVLCAVCVKPLMPACSVLKFFI